PNLKNWLAAGLDIKKTAINVSTLELRADDYSERLFAGLQRAGVEWGCLEIEVTETWAFDDSTATIARNLRALAENGVSIALDDFGTGFASLTHLKSLPISRVKIDRSFVANIVADGESRSIVDAIVRLSHSLGKTVVAEGVEDEAQLAAIRALRRDIAQGFLCSRPVAAEDVPALLLRQTGQRLTRSTPLVRVDEQAGTAIRKAS